MSRLAGKVAFITGVARGQGRSHAVRMAEEGASIIGVDSLTDVDVAPYSMATKEDLAETVALVEKAGGKIIAKQADVRDQAALDAAVAEGVDTFGFLDIVCANAGIMPSIVPSWQWTEADWQATIDIDLGGVWRTTKAAIPAMLAGGRGGSIVLTSSAIGLKAVPGLVGYVAAKAGMVGLMRTLALELGAQGIRVNSVHPTSVGTDMIFTDDLYRAFRPDLESPTVEDVEPILRSTTLLGIPWVEPADVTDAIVWLASDEARYVTGVTLPIDAGNGVK
ncbi:mycofactocin-coupled SDR family oxidoreductase [Nocardia sienata]|uniref:mycofactocin-coupled SDR family oxidoreductase n=1 Tax=Nocardia sienata TaxID=248552 RepID=UPI0007A3C15D|nr:mycofactocin-coupled SDR family oxidoreductase [Nocardia sienata]